MVKGAHEPVLAGSEDIKVTPSRFRLGDCRGYCFSDTAAALALALTAA